MKDENTSEEASLSLAEELGNTFDELSQDDLPDQEITDTDESEDSEVEESAPESDTEQASVSDTEEEQDTVIDLPYGWSKDKAELWSKLEPDVQQVIVEREQQRNKDYTQKTQDISELMKTFEPYEDRLNLAGESKASVVQRLLAAQNYLETNPKEAIQWLAKSYGVELGSQQEVEDDLDDPELREVKNELKSLKEKLSQREQQEVQQSQQSLQAQVKNFQEATDSEGNLLHPHFDSVRVEMGALINSGRATDLDQAYEMAIWANPEMRQELLKQQQESITKTTKQAKQQKVTQAKKAKTPSSSGEAVKVKQDKSLMDELSDTFDKLS